MPTKPYVVAFSVRNQDYTVAGGAFVEMGHSASKWGWHRNWKVLHFASLPLHTSYIGTVMNLLPYTHTQVIGLNILVMLSRVEFLTKTVKFMKT